MGRSSPTAVMPVMPDTAEATQTPPAGSDVIYTERHSDSPFIDSIWHVRVEADGGLTLPADASWQMCIMRQDSTTRLAVSGPTTKAHTLDYKAGADWFGIRFTLSTFMPTLPASDFVDTQIILPDAVRNSFWLGGSAWQFSDPENAETFVDWLAHDGLIVREPVVDATLRGQPQPMSLRSIQRRFLQVTGMTYRAVRQIERARYAAQLLCDGESILDTVYKTGFSDQPHLTHSLKHLIGQTPARIPD